jgi:hypothetical protein
MHTPPPARKRPDTTTIATPPDQSMKTATRKKILGEKKPWKSNHQRGSHRNRENKPSKGSRGKSARDLNKSRASWFSRSSGERGSKLPSLLRICRPLRSVSSWGARGKSASSSMHRRQREQRRMITTTPCCSTNPQAGGDQGKFVLATAPPCRSHLSSQHSISINRRS